MTRKAVVKDWILEDPSPELLVGYNRAIQFSNSWKGGT